MDSNCTRAAHTLFRGVIVNSNSLIEDSRLKLANFTNTLNDGLSVLWTIKHREEIWEIMKMFKFFKSELLLSIEKTPWLLNSGTMEAFRNITGRMHFDLDNVIHDLLGDASFMRYEHEECEIKFAKLGRIALYFCALKNLPLIRNSKLYDTA
ncbi:unnamed protein product [Caenorhabditis angaria]|uniref:Uncharacterized protein n=1 Tax=Caenorhabditis angaria TaxID=860376 RepID=A0A9P1N428_9PELO|nr:unnamed protein product [Caenorhabditis angaria]